ncbi:MAG: argininosuccinate synthase [Chloroflexi bacterium]|nr:argininosuccinate synthase [Chloroflexota bacterium]
MEKIVLAYSGGLDTSVAIPWLVQNYKAEVIALTLDLGGGDRDLEEVRRKALRSGAAEALVIDARQQFVRDFVFPALQAGAIYEGVYPLATALGRPLITQIMVQVARKVGATAVAHGSTGKGNDQVRFEASAGALAPDLRVIAPIREWGMTREEEIRYAEAHGIPVPVTVASPYSIDQNLWGRSIECGVLEDPWVEPPEEVYAWTRAPEQALNTPGYIEIGFEQGIPVTLDGQPMDGVELVGRLTALAEEHGIGRIDHLENRLVGIKSREIYESPAAVVLHQAHRALEAMTLPKDTARFKVTVAREYADLVYNGLWFSPFRQDLQAFVTSSQRYVTGAVRVRLYKGACVVVGRRSQYSLYDFNLATYEAGDTFDAQAGAGFTKIWGLPLRTQARKQSSPIHRPEG